MQLMTWWTPNSPHSDKVGVIAEGAVRSGKTLIMSFAFVVWSMTSFDRTNFAICGKTVGSLRRNVISSLKEVLTDRGYKVIDRKGENYLVIAKGKKRNIYYLFGGRDERSQDLIQGITLGGILLDEVALMPRSFVEQAMARCSVDGAKYWFNCNPEGPQHWFYVEHVKKYKERKYIRIHFNIEDNLSLSKSTIERYKSMFSGIFYRRFILGEWAFADGVIYDCFSPEKNTYNNANKLEVLPIAVLENDMVNGGLPWYACDYGVFNPMVFLECYKQYRDGDPVPHFYIENEYYYDGRKNMKQKSDDEYVAELNKFIGEKQSKALIVDPSASSFIVAARNAGHMVMKANNDVLEGIREVYALLNSGHIKINSDNCPMLINELGLYVWNDKSGERGKEEPVKANDHACDALRYFIATTTPKIAIYATVGESNGRRV